MRNDWLVILAQNHLELFNIIFLPPPRQSFNILFSSIKWIIIDFIVNLK